MNLTTQQSLTLHHDLLWKDEHAWSPITSQVDITLSGAMLIEQSVQLSGRTISLEAPNPEMAWHTRETVDQLRAWSVIAGQQFRLTIEDGRSFKVVFRHHEPPVLEATPVTNIATFDQSDWWQIKLKFMEI